MADGTDDRTGPRSLDGSISEAVAELRDGSTRGFYLVKSDGQKTTEVYHDLDPDEWVYDVPETRASRQILLSYAIASLEKDCDQSLKEVLVAIGTTASALFPGGRVVEYHTESGRGDEEDDND